jgi:hypothetical protein
MQLYESIEPGSRMMISRAWGEERENLELLFNE